MKPEERTWQRLFEDHGSQYSGHHEICACVYDADTDCTGGKSESAREETPHDSVKCEIQQKEELCRVLARSVDKTK